MATDFETYEPTDEELAFIEQDDDVDVGGSVSTMEDVNGPMTFAAQVTFDRACWAMAGVLRNHGVRADMELAAEWARAFGPDYEGAADEAASWLTAGWRRLAVIRAARRLVSLPEELDAVLTSYGRSVEQVERGELPGFCGPEHWLEAVATDLPRRKT